MTEPLSLLIVAVAFLLAGFVKGVIGLGLPTVAIGLLSLVMTPAQAAAILIVPSVATNLWQLAGPRLRELGARLWPMMAGIVVAALATATLLPPDRSGLAVLFLGLVLVAYAALGLAAVTFRVAPRTERWLGPLVGLGTGVMTTLTGLFVIPALPYIQALGFSRDDLVQALGIHFTVSTFALAAALAIRGVVQDSIADGSLVVLSLAALLPALLGMFVGQRVRHRISPGVFRTCFFVGMLALGLHLVARFFL